MPATTTKIRARGLVLPLALLLFAACDNQGPLEKTGQNLDKAFPSEQTGPFEHSGEQIDKTGPKEKPAGE